MTMTETSRLFYLIIVLIVIFALFYAGDSFSFGMLAAAGLAGALFLGAMEKTRPGIFIPIAIILSVSWIILDQAGWTSIVFIAMLVVCFVWRYARFDSLMPDDRIYLPAITLVLSIMILALLRSLLHEPINDVSSFIGLKGAREWFFREAMTGVGDLSGETKEEYIKMVQEIRRQFPWYFVGLQIVAFSFIMNFTLRYLRPFHRKLPHPFFFQIHERYVLLLILAMAIEIFRYLFEQKALINISRPFLIFLGATYFLNGLAVIGFMFMAGRSRFSSFFSRLLFMMVIFLVLIRPIICSALGLFDIWFDFRKLKRISGGAKK